MDAWEQCWCVRHSLDCHVICCSDVQLCLNKLALLLRCLRQATSSYFYRALSPACGLLQQTSLYMDVSALPACCTASSLHRAPCTEPVIIIVGGSAFCVKPR